MKNAGIAVAIVSILLNIYCIMSINRLKSSNDSLSKTLERMYKEGAPSKEKHGDLDDEHEEHEVEVANIMTNIQRHFGKLYFAGKAENWELAEFYAHEVEEAMEELEESHVVEDGINISQFMKIMGLTPLDNLDEAVDTKDLTEFNAAYTAQIAQCNACHAATKHAYIQIKEPERPVFSNQIFTPAGQ